MSNTCGNCDCADKTQCVKGNNVVQVVETQKSCMETVVTSAAENDGCKCGASCSCTNCTCNNCSCGH
ncbi:cystathionine beta-lyase [Stylosanthes scabra]|uniref:Cystathionine beta-lyase n=1 Tax=Stylosanthes scabra TaxID=79078 RepID=A0ABU6XWP3_9FABA|nr:cystathionine beta-lyase [Stylosanthes scabra]